MKKNAEIFIAIRKKRIFQYCIAIIAAVLLFSGSMYAQVKDNNSELKNLKVKIVKVLDNGEVIVSEKTIENENEDLKNLLDKFVGNDESENSSKVVKTKIVVVNTGELDESGFNTTSCSLPPHCKDFLKKHCKEFKKCPNDSMSNCCKKFMQNCDTSKCKIVQCYAMCKEKGRTSKKNKDELTIESEKEENLSSLHIEKLEIFPNPNNGTINLRFSLNERQPVLISVKDITGKTIFKKKIKDFEGEYNDQINLGSVKPGIYFLSIDQKKQSITNKFVVE